MISITLLNHAAVIIELGEIRLLCDPWFEGSCFSGGWGLKYNNSNAMDEIKSCTHLWVSHFHGDHFHVPTLKRILDVNPDICVLGNTSYNFQLDGAMRSLGFANIVQVQERRELSLSSTVSIKRYPATGIDNMLVIKSPFGTVLNFNDCNIPHKARKWLASQLGFIDIFLTNFNHASKLIDYPKRSPDQIKTEMSQRFTSICNSFQTKWIIPFASHHTYLAPESEDQNASLMTVDEIAKLDSKVVPLQVGQKVSFAEAGFDLVKTNSVSLNQTTLINRQHSTSLEAVKKSFEGYRSRINNRFFYLTYLIPQLVIQLVDHDCNLSFSFYNGMREIPQDSNKAHISAHSSCLEECFSKNYGTDSFWVGGHFDLLSPRLAPLRWQLLVSLMIENRVDLVSLVGCLFSFKGWQFLWCRREEILSILLSSQIAIGSRD